MQPKKSPRVPTYSAIGLIALVIALVVLAPALYGIWRVERLGDQSKRLAVQNAQSIEVLAGQQTQLARQQALLAAQQAQIATIVRSVRELAREGVEAHTAACTTRKNYNDQIEDSTKYLNDIRAGRRAIIPGITEADILQSIARQKLLVASLKNLTCP